MGHHVKQNNIPVPWSKQHKTFVLCFVAIAHDFVYIMCSKTAFLHANLLSKYVTGSTWRIIPVSKLLITMAGRPPNNPPNGFFRRSETTYPSPSVLGWFIRPTPTKMAFHYPNCQSKTETDPVPPAFAWRLARVSKLWPSASSPWGNCCQLVGARWGSPLRWFIGG